MIEYESDNKLVEVFTRFAYENDISFQRPTNDQIVLAVESDHNDLSTVFQIHSDDEYEHYTSVLVVPDDKRGKIAEAAIGEAFRDISPVLPADDERLFVYGNRSGLRNKSDEEIRNFILDDMGRIAGYDNEKYLVFQEILNLP